MSVQYWVERCVRITAGVRSGMEVMDGSSGWSSGFQVTALLTLVSHLPLNNTVM